MDPLTAISMASAVVQFVDFGRKVLSKSYELSRSVDGVLLEVADLACVTRDLQTVSSRLHGRDDEDEEAQARSPPTIEERQLEDMAVRCSAAAEQLSAKLNLLSSKQTTKNQRWRSVRQALKTVWAKDEIDQMASMLDRFRNELQMHVLVSTKMKTDRLEIQNSALMHLLDLRAREILQLLERNESPFRNDDIAAQTLVVTQLHEEVKRHDTDEHLRTRADIIQAIEDHKRGYFSESRCSSSRSTEINETLIEDALLDSLRFPTMSHRYDTVTDAHAKTFDWIFHAQPASPTAWSNFSTWLSEGEGAYWINGKAGSGKSTLMRYICEDARTARLLARWAGSGSGSPEHLLMGNFFFWNSGSPDQASQLGLLRSVLYSILHRKRHLLCDIFPARMERLQKSVRASSQHPWPEQPWTVPEVKRAARELFRRDLGHVCIFIDGLDEYAGDVSETIQLVNSLVTPRVKFCLSSRPLVQFKAAYEGYPSLRLQDLTADDIRTFVTDKLQTDERTAALTSCTAAEIKRLADEVQDKAKGVFLWVQVVVESLLRGISNGDHMEHLEQRLIRVPSDLKRLYAAMFASIPAIYGAESAQIFQMMETYTALDVRHGMDAETLYFALTETYESVHVQAIGPLRFPELSTRLRHVDRRLKVCCAGLLEMTSSRNTVAYIHKTAREFVREQATWAAVMHQTPTGFVAADAILKSLIFELKTCHLYKALRRDLLYEVSTFIGNMVRSGREPAMGLLATFENIYAYLIQHDAVGEHYPKDFLALAVEIPLQSYVCARLHLLEGSQPTTTTTLLLSRSGEDRSYLSYAARLSASLRNFHARRDMIALLVRHSSYDDLQEGWAEHLKCMLDVRAKRPSTEARLLETVRLYLVHGADPASRVVSTQRRIDGEKEIAGCGGDKASCSAVDVLGAEVLGRRWFL